jgi:transposase
LAGRGGAGVIRRVLVAVTGSVVNDGEKCGCSIRRCFAPLGRYDRFLAMTTTLVEELVPDELWQVVAPLLPAPPRPPDGGRRRTVPDRNCLAAIVYMSRTSTPWRLLPAGELGCGSPATVWRRLDEWAKAGVFDALHLEVLDQLGEQDRLDWSRASVDTMSVRAKRGGTTWAQIPSIVASRAPSFTWSATARACRSPWRSPPPIPTTASYLRAPG